MKNNPTPRSPLLRTKTAWLVFAFTLVAVLAPAPQAPSTAVAEESAPVEQSGALPGPREATAATFDGTFAYVFGGSDAKRLTDIVRYHPATGQVTKLSSKLPEGRDQASAAFDGLYSYIIGGKNSGSGLSDIIRFHAASGAVVSMGAKLPTALQGTSAVFDGTHVLVFGGFGAGPTNSIFHYHPATDTLSLSAATLPGGRTETSAIWDGTHAYIFGGKNDVRYDQIVRYDPSTQTTSLMTAKLPTPRHATSAYFDGEFAYILGGRDAEGRLNQIIRYHPATDSLTVLAAKFPTERELTSAVFDGSQGLVFGGRNNGHRLADILSLDLTVGAPMNLRAETGPAEDQITLTWDPPAEQPSLGPVLQYRIYRGSASGATTPYDYVAGDPKYVDSGIPAGVVRYYRVTAVYANGEGAFSNEAHAATTVGELEPLPSPRENTEAVWINGAAYVIGGSSQTQNAASASGFYYGANGQVLRLGSAGETPDTPVPEIVKYDPESGEVRVLDIPLPPKCCAAAIGTETLVYLFGADGDEKCCVQQAGRSAGSTSVPVEEEAGRAIYVFDPVAETLTQLEQTLPDAVCCISGFYTGVYIYLFGGADDEKCCDADLGAGAGSAGASGDIIRFDPDSGEITVLDTTLPIPKCCFPAVWDGAYGYLFGGSDDPDRKCCDTSGRGATNQDDGLQQDIIRFDPESETIEVLGTELPIPKCCFSGVFDGSLIYLFGGEGDDEKCCDAEGVATGSESKLNEILVFNPRDHTIRTLTETLPSARSHTSAVWDGQRALLFGGDDGQQSLADVLGFYPGAPQNPRAQAGPGRGEIRVTWDPPADGSDATAAGYHVWRAAPGGAFQQIGTTSVTVRNFTDSDLGDGTTFSYRVSAFDATNEGPQSRAVTATTFRASAAPRNLEAEIGPEIGEVTLTWDPPEDTGGAPVLEYRVYRRTDLSPGSLYATVPGDVTTYVDQDCDLASVSCYYTVTALTPVGESAHSNEAAAIGTDVPVHAPGGAGPSGGAPWKAERAVGASEFAAGVGPQPRPVTAPLR